MQEHFYGTRGSIPAPGADKIRYGGQTTCLRVISDCLPEGEWLGVDTGSGAHVMSNDFLRLKGKAVTFLQTHEHHDHTQGFPMTCFPHIRTLPVFIYGPKQDGMGPKEVFRSIMRPPVFPVDLRAIDDHIRFYAIEHPNKTVLIIHPQGGRKLTTRDQFSIWESKRGQVPFRDGMKFNVSECLVIYMWQSHHPERTISYRFEERPTGQTFVFLTDHENTDGVSKDLRAHLAGANLLVMDTQYTRETYDSRTAGYGHSTPDYVAMVACSTGVKALGLTHHDPDASDDQIDAIVQTALKCVRDAGNSIPVFGCRDNMTLDVGDISESLQE